MGKKTSFQNKDATQYLKGWEIMGRKIHSKEKTSKRKYIFLFCKKDKDGKTDRKRLCGRD